MIFLYHLYHLSSLKLEERLTFRANRERQCAYVRQNPVDPVCARVFQAINYSTLNRNQTSGEKKIFKLLDIRARFQEWEPTV